MEKIIGQLYVGNDQDFLKVKDRKGWSTLRCCKEGAGGHRETAKYTTAGAPKGEDYLAAGTGSHLALNFIDPHDPHFIQIEMLRKGLKFIQERLDAGDKVLIACNRGHSRGPTTAMLFMRSIGELPNTFVGSENIFRTLYPNYDPGIGMRTFARSHWSDFEKGSNEQGI